MQHEPNQTYLNSSEYLDPWSDFSSYQSVYWRYSDTCILVLCIFGLLSSLLTLLTIYGNDHFSEPCFVCYIAVAVSEFIYTITYAFSRWATLNGLFTSSYSWARFSKDRQPLFDVSVSATTILIVFLSLHRAVACLLPNKYYWFNTKRVCVGVVIFAYVASAFHAVPQLFAYDYKADNETGRFAAIYSQFGLSQAYITYATVIDTYRLVQGLAHFVSSTLAIIGMLRAISLKRRLFRKVATRQQPTTTQPLQAVKQNLQLCFLQLSQAIPMVCDSVFIFVVTTKYPPDRETIYDNEGKMDWTYAYNWIYMWCLTDVFHCSAHCTHFYLYLLFSKGFRQGFVHRFLKMVPKPRKELTMYTLRVQRKSG